MSSFSVRQAFNSSSSICEVLTSVLHGRGATPPVILECGVNAHALGLKELSDLHQPYMDHICGGPSPLWNDLGVALEAGGVPTIARCTVLAGLAAELRRVVPCDPAASPATHQLDKRATVDMPSLIPVPSFSIGADIRPDGSASSRAGIGGRPFGRVDHVLPNQLADLALVSKRITEMIQLNETSMKRQAARVPGYSTRSNWKRKIPSSHSYWNQLGAHPVHAPLSPSRSLLPTRLMIAPTLPRAQTCLHCANWKRASKFW